MSKQDYYETLGVSKGSSPEEIKRAYRKKAMKFHPDTNSGNKEAETKFKEINEAYDVLKDPQKKSAYDQFGHSAFTSGMGGGAGGAGAGFGGFDFNNASGGFGDIFENIFSDFMGGQAGGQRGGRKPSLRGADLRYNVSISLEEAFFGLSKQIKIKKNDKCDKCDGTGSADKAKPKTCPECGGVGQIRTRQGFFSVNKTCPRCYGSGVIVENPCDKCNGTGAHQKSKTIDVKIPAGIDSGNRVKISGEGEAGFHNAPSGDLYLFINVEGHKKFYREGEHLIMDLPISFTTAILGGEIKLPLIDKTTVNVKIPKGIQYGEQLKVKSKGMSVINSSIRGDLFLNVKVLIPKKLSKKQEEIIKEFEEDGSSESKSFFKKIKEYIDL